MAERNVITIIIQAIDRASGVLRKQREELQQLERAETRATPTTRALNEEQGKLATSAEKVTRGLDKENKQLHLQMRSMQDLRQEHDRLRNSIRATDREQLTFFEHLSNFQRKSGDFFGQRQRETIQGRGGRILGSQMLPLAGGGGGDVGGGGALPGQTRLQIADTETLLNLMPKLGRESADLQGDFSDLSRSARGFFNAVREGDRPLRDLVRQFKALRGREGIGGRQLNEFFAQEQSRLQGLRKQATTFDERNDILRQIRGVQLLERELHGLRVTIADLNKLGGGLNLPGLTDDNLPQRLLAAERSVRRLSDSLGENGLRGASRDVGRGFDRDIAVPIARHVTPRLQRLNALLGTSRRELDAFGASLNRRQKGLLGLTKFDDTVQLGLRRLARMLVIVSTFIPFLVAGFSTLVAAITALVGGVTALAGAFGQLGGVLATLPALLGATLGAFIAFKTVVGPGITQISTRFKEALQIQDAARKKTTESTNAIAGAEQTLNDTITRNAEQVADLQGRIADQRRSSSEEETDQERDLSRLRVTNHQQEMDAVRALRRARRDAAQDAAQAEKDYKKLLEDNRKDERDLAAELSARRAQLGSLLLQGADQNTIDVAQAGVRRAEQEFAKEQTANRKQEHAALRTMTKQKQSNAEQVADDERRLARTRTTNNQQEADAERKLARTRRDNAEQLVQLETQLTRMRRDNANSQQAAVAALAEQQRKSSGDLKDTLVGLEPIQKRIVLQLLRIRDEWRKLTASTRLGAELLGEKALSFLEARLPAIAERANQFVRVITALGEQAFTRFTRPEAIDRINRILDDSVALTKQLGESLINVADAFLIIADHARPVTQRIGKLVEDIGKGLLESTQKSEKTGGLDSFFAGTNRVLDLTIDLMKQLGVALLNVLKLGAPFGEVLLTDFVEWAKSVRDFTENEGPAISSFFADSVPVVEALGGLLTEVTKQLFILGRELIRPDATGNVFLIDTIDRIKGGLPGLTEFFIKMTRESGPALLDFLASLGRFIGSLVGPNGPFIVFLGVLTGVFNAIAKLPDGLERMALAFFAFGGILGTVAKNMRAFVAMLTLSTEKIAVGGAAATLGAAKGTLFGLSIAALIAFPGLIDKVTAALDALIKVVQVVVGGFEKLTGVFGPAQGKIDGFLQTLIALEIGLRLLGGTSLLRLIAQIRLFIALMRESQRITIFGRALEALSAFFPAVAAALSRAIAALRRYIATMRPARRENELFAASNIAASFSGMVSGIGAAIQALIAYIRQVKAARTANLALAGSNAAVGFSGLIAGVGGIGGLLGGLGSRLTSLVGLLPRVAGMLARLGAVGTAGAIAGIALALSQLGVEVDKLVPSLKRLDDFMARFIGDDVIIKKVKDIGLKLLNLGPDPFGIRKFVQDATSSTDDSLTVLQTIGQHVATALDGLSTAFGDAMRSSLFRMDVMLGEMHDKFVKIDTDLQGFMETISSIQSSVGGFIRGRAEATDVPAQRELDRIDQQETVRQRQQQVTNANKELADIKKQVRERAQTLEVAQRRLARLQARVGTGRAAPTRAQIRDASLNDRGSSLTILTPEQRRVLRTQQRNVEEQQRIVAQRKRELNEVEAQVREVAARRAETLHQVQLAERREVLAREAVTQRIQRENEIRAATQRAEDAVAAYEEALNSGKSLGSLKQARKKLFDALAEIGIDRKLTQAWIAGHRLGEDFGSGLSNAVFEFGKKFKTLMQDLVTKNNLKVPVVIVTDVPTIRRVINSPPKPGDSDFIGPVKPKRAAGGPVYGQEGAAVPITAHAGEWVLNRSQQLRVALMAGTDRSILERALFHTLSFKPQFGYAMGGVVSGASSSTIVGGTQFLTPISIQTASPTVDIEYVARAFESRIAAAVE